MYVKLTITMKYKKIDPSKTVLYILGVISLISIIIASGTYTALTLKNEYLKPTIAPTMIPIPTLTLTPTSKVINKQANTKEPCVTFTNLDTGEKRCIYRYEISNYGISSEQFEAKKQNPNLIITDPDDQDNAREDEIINKLNNIENQLR